MRTFGVLLLAAAVMATIAGNAALGESESEKAAREALAKSVETGKKLFSDKALGTTGKTCTTCHANPKKEKMFLKGRVGNYPKYDRGEKKVITLGQKIRKMIQRNLKGKEEALGSDRLVAIEAYLMNLNRGK